MNKSRRAHSVSGVFTFTLLGIFALLSALMVLLGADFYSTHNGLVTSLGDERILTAYMRSALRQADAEDAVSVEELNGIQTVSIRSEYDGEVYYTRYYSYDGSLWEWFSSESREFRPADGEVICACGKMEAVREDGLLHVTVERADGSFVQTDIALRCGQTGGGNEQ